jgi:hypothetical protein
MDILAWTLGLMVWAMSLMCFVTVCMVTFRQGHALLGIPGSFNPVRLAQRREPRR